MTQKLAAGEIIGHKDQVQIEIIGVNNMIPESAICTFRGKILSTSINGLEVQDDIEVVETRSGLYIILSNEAVGRRIEKGGPTYRVPETAVLFGLNGETFTSNKEVIMNMNPTENPFGGLTLHIPLAQKKHVREEKHSLKTN